MSGLLSIALRYLASKRARSALALLAVVLGTSVIAASFTTNAAIEQSQRAAALAMVGNADLIVEALDERGFPQQVVPAIRARPQIELVAPQVQKRTFFRSQDRRGFVELLGVDPDLDPQLHPYRLAEGSFFRSPTERSVLLVSDWAKKSGLGVGSSLDLMTGEGFQKFQVVGLLQEPDLSRRNFGGLVRVPLPVAQSTFGLEDRIQLLSLKVKDPSAMEAAKEGLEDAIPYLFVVRDTPQLLGEIEASIRDFQLALLFFAAIALFAGAFLVFTTLSLTVAEQVREIGLLRAAGAPGSVVMGMTLAQGLFFGTLGAVAGVVLGQILATGLVLLIGATQGIPTFGVAISWVGIAVSLLLGIGVTLGASIVPAFRAARTPVLAALGVGVPPPAKRGRVIRRLLALGCAVGVVSFALFAPEQFRLVKPLSLLLFFPFFIYLSQVALPVLVAVVARPFRWLTREVGLMAERNVRREQGRASITVAGFVISLSLIVALFNGAASFSAAGQRWAQSLFPGDFVVVSPVGQPVELVGEFRGLAGVEQASPISTLPVVWERYYLGAAGVDPAYYFQAFDFRQGERTAAFRELQRGSSVLVPVRLAQDRGITMGDTMRLKAGDQEADFTVAGIIAHSLPSPDDYGALVLNQRDVEQIFRVTTFRFLAVSAAPEANLSELGKEVAKTAELFGMESSAFDDLRQAVASGVGGLVGLLGGLVIIGVVVGALSVFTTMTMNIVERAREIGILRAAGMTSRQIQWLSMIEATIMGALGALLGIVLGAFVTWVVVDLNRSAGFEPSFLFSLPVALAVLVVGTLSAALAAFYPAGLAARTSIVEALRHE